MSVKLRLARGGAKKRPYYRIVAADARAPRDGKFIEMIGTYNPLLSKDNDTRVKLKTERVKYWLEAGAKATDRVQKFLDTVMGSNVMEKRIQKAKAHKETLQKRRAQAQEAIKKSEEKKKNEKEKAKEGENKPA